MVLEEHTVMSPRRAQAVSPPAAHLAVVTGNADPVAAGLRAPPPPGVLLDEQAGAAVGFTRPQPGAGVAQQRRDRVLADRRDCDVELRGAGRPHGGAAGA